MKEIELSEHVTTETAVKEMRLALKDVQSNKSAKHMRGKANMEVLIGAIERQVD